ncbi:MAG: VCBS repeat-containing protein [Lewinellaceae bacterium]|nr:VCBS repeat-containing protein [Lewinellaceae bacterium]
MITQTITNVSIPGGADGSVALIVSGGTSPYIYLWNNSQTTATATGLAAGTYTATVTDNKGCTATTSATVTQPAGSPTLVSLTSTTIRIKYHNPIAPATATAANLPIWGDETGLRAGTYTVSLDTVTFVATTPFRVGELIHITSKSGLQFTGGGATTSFSWVRQSVVTHPTTPVFDTTGTGIILPSAAYASNASYNATMADVNRDGLQDMVFRYHASYGAATNVLVYPRNANGTFAAPATYTNAESHSVLVGTPDVNNDGYPDIVIFHNFPSRIHVRLNNGSGGFGSAALYTVSNYCNGANVYDLDRDGDLDIVAFSGNTSPSFNAINILKNNGNGTFAATTTLATGVAGSSCLPTDINGDGQFELLYTSDAYITGNPVFRVYTNDGNANFSQYSTESNSSIKYIRSAFDYDGNQTPDVLTRNPDIQVHLNHSGLSYSLSTPTVLAADNGWPYTGDLDGDGDLDVLMPIRTMGRIGTPFLKILPKQRQRDIYYDNHRAGAPAPLDDRPVRLRQRRRFGPSLSEPGHGGDQGAA